MKNLKTYGIIALMLGIGSLANAQVKNYFGLWLEGGEWSLLTQESAYQSSTGAAGAAGVLYDMQADHFLLDLGLGARYGLTSFDKSVNLAPVTIPNIVDIDGQPNMTYIYNIHDRKDQYTDLSLQVPIMLGGQWGRFYLMGGVKPRLSLMAQAHTKAYITTTALYYENTNAAGEPLWQELSNAPEAQLYNDLYKEKASKASFRFDLDASLEIGARLGFMTSKTGWDVPKTRTQYRLALFADYGLLDLYPGIRYTNGSPQAALTTPTHFIDKTPNDDQPMISQVTFNDVMSTPDFKEGPDSKPSVHNLMIGVKFTVLFELPKKGTCVLCNDPYRASAHRGSTPRKYQGKVAK